MPGDTGVPSGRFAVLREAMRKASQTQTVRGFTVSTGAKRMRTLRSLLCAALAASCVAVLAQDAGGKPLRLIVPFAPGGSTDVIARVIAPELGRALRQTVVIENRPGGGGTAGTMEMLGSLPDGNTLAMATDSTVAANPAINPKNPYGPGDLVPIVNLAATPTVIAVHPSFPARDYAEFIAELKRRPGVYAYASSGVGGISHLQMETFKSQTKTFISHIPYRGAAPALNDAVSGQVQIVMDAFPSALPFIKAGRLRAIVVTSPQRIAALPEVPTFTEVGLAAMNRMSSFGIIGPKALPPDLVRKINAAARAALEAPAVRQRIEEIGAFAVGGTPEQYAAEIETGFAQLKRVVEERKLSLEGSN